MDESKKSEWLDRYLAPLVGGRVVSAGGVVDSREAWPYLMVRGTDGKHYVLQVWRDEEGNGPGFPYSSDLLDAAREEVAGVES